MIKVAMVRINDVFEKEGFKSKMILQVHDELVFDALKDELDKIRPIVEKEMMNAFTGLSVPMKVDMDTGKNWLEAH
jgi:DNA polymerase-1